MLSKYVLEFLQCGGFIDQDGRILEDKLRTAYTSGNLWELNGCGRYTLRAVRCWLGIPEEPKRFRTGSRTRIYPPLWLSVSALHLLENIGLISDTTVKREQIDFGALKRWLESGAKHRNCGYHTTNELRELAGMKRLPGKRVWICPHCKKQVSKLVEQL